MISSKCPSTENLIPLLGMFSLKLIRLAPHWLGMFRLETNLPAQAGYCNVVEVCGCVGEGDSKF